MIKGISLASGIHPALSLAIIVLTVWFARQCFGLKAWDVPAYHAKVGLSRIQEELASHRKTFGRYPDSLSELKTPSLRAEAGIGSLYDPWGELYIYKTRLGSPGYSLVSSHLDEYKRFRKRSALFRPVAAVLLYLVITSHLAILIAEKQIVGFSHMLICIIPCALLAFSVFVEWIGFSPIGGMLKFQSVQLLHALGMILSILCAGGALLGRHPRGHAPWFVLSTASAFCLFAIVSMSL